VNLPNLKMPVNRFSTNYVAGTLLRYNLLLDSLIYPGDHLPVKILTPEGDVYSLREFERVGQHIKPIPSPAGEDIFI